VIKFIKTTILGYVHSVETITSSLVKTVTALEAHAATQRAQADAKIIAAGKLLAERNDHMDEASKARVVADKIGALLS
jgi:hypothetical protein